MLQVDPRRNFYFLEMNTRLQVEHPVTELITGVDLVEQMIRVGAGEKLSITQEDIPSAGSKGWAVEARVYAENPANDFLPSIGRVLRYEEPAGEGVRVDSGITEGSEISVYYDPMISKLIGYAPTREEACEVLKNALDEYVIRGVQHNTPFLRSCLNNERFLSGEITTAFIEEEFPDGFSGEILSEPSQQNLRTIVAAMYCRDQSCAAQADGGASSLTCLEDEGGMVVSISIDHELVRAPAATPAATGDELSARPPEVLARVRQLGDDLFGVSVDDGEEVMVELDWASEALQYATIGGDVEDAHVVQLHSTPLPGAGGGTWEVQYQGAVGSVKARPVRTAELEPLMPLPAVIDTYKVSNGSLPWRCATR
jgi:acetyl/propionyl-CoA carboxylase alpha subunit